MNRDDIMDSLRAMKTHLTCGLCLGIFNEPSTMPVCQHHFCKNCLVQYWNKKGHVQCPQCFLPSWANEVSRNPSLINIVESWKDLYSVFTKYSQLNDDSSDNNDIEDKVVNKKRKYDNRDDTLLLEDTSQKVYSKEKNDSSIMISNENIINQSQKPMMTNQNKNHKSDPNSLKVDSFEINTEDIEALHNRSLAYQDKANRIKNEIVNKCNQFELSPNSRQKVNELIFTTKDEMGTTPAKPPNIDLNLKLSPQNLSNIKSSGGTIIDDKEVNRIISTNDNDDDKRKINSKQIDEYVLLCTACKTSDLKKITRLCGLLGGRTVNKYSNEVTHLITRCVDARGKLSKRTAKYMQALIGGKWILSYQWIEQCIDEVKWVPEEPFELDGCIFENSSELSAAKIPQKCRLLSIEQRQLLFKDCCIYIDASVWYRNDPNIDDLRYMILSCGGTLVNTLQELVKSRRNLSVLVTSPSRRQDDINIPSSIHSATATWILDCVTYFNLCDVNNYELVPNDDEVLLLD